MGATLTSLLNGEHPTLCYVIAIEGYQYLLTTGSTSAAVTAWSGTDWSSALSGLEINWEQSQALNPWNAFESISGLTFKVMDCDGTDQFGIDTHRREGGTETKLAADVDTNDTTITVARADDFAASGTIYLGTEAMAYSSRDTGADTFTISTRGKWAPFTTESGGRFARSHQLTQVMPGVPPMATAATTVRTLPTEWAGKWVGVWIHAVRSGGVLDTKAEAHLAFAGRLTADPFRDTPEGYTVVSCEDVRATIRDTVILRRQFKARVKEGIYLPEGLRFGMHTLRSQSASDSSLDAEVLTAVVGASGDNEIEAGWTTGAELEAAINNWLAAEKTAGRLVFDITYRFFTSCEEGLRPSLRFDDASLISGRRSGWLNTGGASAPDVRVALGWGAGPGPNGGLAFDTSETSETVYGPAPPVRVNAGWVQYDTTVSLNLEAVSGSFVDQTSFLPPVAQSAAFSDGVLRIGDDFFACDTPSIAAGEGTVNIRRIRELDSAIGAKPSKLLLTVEDAGDLVVSQVLMLEGTLKSIAMTLLTSTGVASFNGDYDLLPAQCGAGIPWSLLTADFENELDAVANDSPAIAVVVAEPMSLPEIFNVSLVLRNAHPMWYRGRLKLVGFATPTSAATETLAADSKATPASLSAPDFHRAVSEYSEKWWKNVLLIKHNRNIADGSYRDTMNLLGVESGAGERRQVMEARNAIRGAGFIIGEDINAIAPRFVSGLSFLTRPALIVRVPVDYTKWETLIPGTVLLFTDPHMRDPTDGERGVTAKPALVIGQSYSWGGPSLGTGRGGEAQEAHGHVDLMCFPQMSLAAYSPTAEVDYTGTNGGYDAVAFSLTCASHRHSESTEAVDASHFAANDVVTICEIDPADPAAPTTWDRTIASVSGDLITLTAALTTPTWDSAKRYRIYSQTYASATTSQKAKVFQADDADALVANLRQPYGYGHGIQATSGTSTPATTLARRHTAATYGDGAPLTTGAAYDTAVNLNNLISYGTAPHSPAVYSEPGIYAGSGTRRLVRVSPFFVGIGRLAANQTRKLWVSPRFKSDDGTSCTVRVSLCRNPPKSADPTAPSLNDVERVGAYTEVSFTTSSTSYTIPTADDLDVSHLQLGEGIIGGIGWLLTEVTNHAVVDGLAECWLGPVVAG